MKRLHCSEETCLQAEMMLIALRCCRAFTGTRSFFPYLPEGNFSLEPRLPDSLATASAANTAVAS